MAIVDDSGVVEVKAIQAINEKRVFPGAVIGNIKSTVIS